MIKQHLKILTTVGLMTMTTPSMAIIYNIFDPGLSNGYGYSGTITTDNSIGTFTNASAITDWNITLITPGAVDGVSSETITNANSTVTFNALNAALEITASEINITSAPSGLPAALIFFPPSDFLELDGASATSPYGVALQDGSETPGLGIFTNATNGGSFTVATVVPVPAAVWLFGSGLLGLIGISRRKQTLG